MASEGLDLGELALNTPAQDSSNILRLYKLPVASMGYLETDVNTHGFSCLFVSSLEVLVAIMLIQKAERYNCTIQG